MEARARSEQGTNGERDIVHGWKSQEGSQRESGTRVAREESCRVDKMDKQDNSKMETGDSCRGLARGVNTDGV